MFLRAKTRYKDGKLHRYWSIVESRRVHGKGVVQRQVMYLGEINDAQHHAWCKSIEVLSEDTRMVRQMALFPAEAPVPALDCDVVQVKLNELSVRHPRQWGACWLALRLWDQLALDTFWQSRLAPSRKGTRWLDRLKTLVCYRLIAPGSEWRLHRQWYGHSAMADLLGTEAPVIGDDTLYRCLDRLLAHKTPMFTFLKQRWTDLFGATFEVLLYDLTSTYFECDPPAEGKRRFGYSRDKRSDCVQVVIALIVTPEGLPLAYEVLAGNTSDKTTLADFLDKIETQYGKAHRIWVMDRGIPTEAVLADMCTRATPVSYLIGTPRGRLNALEQAFLDRPWEHVREAVQVKLLEHNGELYILAKSADRVHKERAMRSRKLKRLWKRLQHLQRQALSLHEFLIKLGAAKSEAGRASTLVDIQWPDTEAEFAREGFQFTLNTTKLRRQRRREGHYLLRSNLTTADPAQLWQQYVQLTEVEQAFKELKSDLAIRPIYHQRDDRIEAHIFVAFIAYCLQVTLKQRLRPLAPGLTPRAVLEQVASLQMVDIHLPTTDGRELILTRYTEPDLDHRLLLKRLNLDWPIQPPPKIRVQAVPRVTPP